MTDKITPLTPEKIATQATVVLDLLAGCPTMTTDLSELAAILAAAAECVRQAHAQQLLTIQVFNALRLQ